MISSLIAKVKKLVDDYQTKKWWDSLTPEEQHYWYSGRTAEQVAEEERRKLEEEQYLADYLKQQKEEQERKERELLEERRAMEAVEEERRVLQEIRDEIIRKREQCPKCGQSVWECCCYLNEREEVSETTLIQRQCAEADEEKEIPQWLEEANTLCLTCGLLPEFCRCQCEE